VFRVRFAADSIVTLALWHTLTRIRTVFWCVQYSEGYRETASLEKDMFEQSFVATSAAKPRNVALALLGQALLVGILVIIPILYVQPLPTIPLTSMVSIPLAPPPPPPPARAVRSHAERVVPKKFVFKQFTAPVTIPKEVPAIADAPAPLLDNPVIAGVPGGVPGGQANGVIGGVLSGLPGPPPPPPPAAKHVEEPQPAAPEIIRVGGEVQAALLVREVEPVYPKLARQAHIAGTVVMNAIIGKDGSVQDLKLVSGNPLLVESAMEAVRQWVYKPTILNGKPVEVGTEIDIHFRLA
jgi:protein TonB